MAGRADGLIVVIDTSCLVSAALKRDSVPEHAVLRAIATDCTLFVSRDIEREYREVLGRSKFDRYASVERRMSLLDALTRSAEWCEPSVRIMACRDPKDDKFLSFAAAVRADVILSSDIHHLLDMDPWRGIRILSPADFLRSAPKLPSL